MSWININTETFLKRGYLLNGQSIEDRLKQIGDYAQNILLKMYEKYNSDESGAVPYNDVIYNFSDKFFIYAMKGYYVLPSPCWSNFGTGRGSAISCFNTHVGDSVESILQAVAEVGTQSKVGGGTSAYFGALRPRGADIKNNGTSGGVYSFLPLFESTQNVISQGKCYIEGTKVLTNHGFKYFKDVKIGYDKIADVNEFGDVLFTDNYELVDYNYSGKIISIKTTKKNEDIIKVTPNHRMVIERESSKGWKGSTEIVLAKNLKLHRNNRFILSGNSLHKSKSLLTPDEQLMIAFQADGEKNTNSTIRFKFKKERKIQRLKQILSKTNYEYSLRVTDDNVSIFIIKNVKHLKKKLFHEWVSLENSNEWNKNFIEELSYWDSTLKNNTIIYSTIIEENAKFVQAIGSLCSLKTRLVKHENKGENRSTLFTVSFSNKNIIGGDSCTIYNEEYNGKIYCAVVPNGRLIVEYNGKTLVCGNTRRGSTAVYLDLSHPDIKEFLTIRDDENPIQQLSFGVCVTDEWLQQMKDGDSEKRSIWADVIRKRCQTGYPYIFFTDNVNNNTVDVYKDKGFKINSSNLCTEILLPSTENESFVCDLNAFNLELWDEYKDNYEVFLIATLLCDAMMEDFIIYNENKMFMERTVNFAKRHRAIALGASGYHSYLQSKMIPFESLQARLHNKIIFKTIQDNVYKASKEMATLFGTPELLVGYGRRNSTLTAIAPNTSSSFIIGQQSQSIEPYVSNYYIKDTAKMKYSVRNPFLKKVLQKHNMDTEETWLSILKDEGSVQNLHFLTDVEKQVFKTFQEINQYELIEQTAARQKYIDNGQSLNLMVDSSASPKELNKLLLTAHEKGIKTLYYQLNTNAAQKFTNTLAEQCVACSG